MISIYISYVLSTWLRNINTDFTSKNCWYGFVKLTKNADPEKYKYIVYGIGFASRWEFSFKSGSMGKNVTIVGADMNLSICACW